MNKEFEIRKQAAEVYFDTEEARQLKDIKSFYAESEKWRAHLLELRLLSAFHEGFIAGRKSK